MWIVITFHIPLQLEEEEKERKEEEEYLRLMEEQRKAEEDRLRKAIEEADRQREEEAKRKEEEEKQREEVSCNMWKEVGFFSCKKAIHAQVHLKSEFQVMFSKRNKKLSHQNNFLFVSIFQILRYKKKCIMVL